MSKIAKLVSVTIITRIIVEDTDTDEQIINKALPRIKNNIQTDGLSECVDGIINDVDSPYDPEWDDDDEK